MHDFKTIGYVCDKNSKESVAVARTLCEKYGVFDIAKSDQVPDAVVAIGGDGMMLKTLHKYHNRSAPIYGINMGSVGFLLNDCVIEKFWNSIQNSIVVKLYPLQMDVMTASGEKHSAFAINEVSLFRATNQAAKIKILVNDQIRLEELVCDGIIVSTPAGSTAYNLAANGPILPLDSNLLALTPISPFRPRRWRGALLTNDNTISFEALSVYKRPISAVADSIEFRNVQSVSIKRRSDVSFSLLFDKEQGFESRIIKEQFGISTL